MMNLTPEELRVFHLRGIIAERKYAQEKLKKTESEIDYLNEMSEKKQIEYENEKNPASKKAIIQTITNFRGKVRCLTKVRQMLFLDLKITPPTDDKSASIGFQAKEAEDKLIEMGVY